MTTGPVLSRVTATVGGYTISEPNIKKGPPTGIGGSSSPAQVLYDRGGVRDEAHVVSEDGVFRAPLPPLILSEGAVDSRLDIHLLPVLAHVDEGEEDLLQHHTSAHASLRTARKNKKSGWANHTALCSADSLLFI